MVLNMIQLLKRRHGAKKSTDTSPRESAPAPACGEVREKIIGGMTVGCFDVFHRGHKALIEKLMAISDVISVGVHNDSSIKGNKGITPTDSTAHRVAKVKAMLRPGDDVFVVDACDPTECMAAAAQRLRNAGVTTLVYGRGDDWAQFPGRPWLEAEDVAIHLFKYTEGVSSTHLRKQWWATVKILPDAPAVSLLHVHEAVVYAPLKRFLVRHVASHLPRALSPNHVTTAAVLSAVPFVAALSHGRYGAAAAVGIAHDMMDRLDGAVAQACAARGQPHDGQFGAFYDAMCDKVFGVAQLVAVTCLLLAECAALDASGVLTTANPVARIHIAIQISAWMFLVMTKLVLHFCLAQVRIQDYLSSRRVGSSSTAKKGGGGAVATSSIPAVGEGKLATFAENTACVLLAACMTVTPLLAQPNAGAAQVCACAACNLLCGGLLVLSIDMAIRSLRHKLVARV